MEKPPTYGSRITTPFLIVSFVLVMGVVASYMMGLEVIRGHEQASRVQESIIKIERLLSTLKDAETGQRGYLLTGDERYLEPYNDAKEHILRDLRQLNLKPSPEKKRLWDMINGKLIELDQTISLRREKGLPAAMEIVTGGVGRDLMGAVRKLTTELEQVEIDQGEQLKQKLNLLSWARTMTFVGSIVLCLSFLAWAHQRIKKELARSQAIRSALLREKELRAVALGSIGDGLIMTDDKAIITYMNGVAEDLTGWKSEEARGRPCSEVFNIINETTRRLVESPVDKVLREGVIVGLANHTLLIRRDLTEISIDDSGAPIRDEEGQVRGVVLVFRDFSGHRASETALRAAKEEAETANIAKDNFLATLSHELRTPLTPVSVTLNMWENDSSLPPGMLADVQMMRRNIDLEARLIDDLLDLTRIVRGKLHFNLEISDVHDLLKAVKGIYQSEMRSKHLELDMNLQASPHYVSADPARLQQVFWNILKNATKFSPDGGRITVETSNGGDGIIQITFHDDGIGMSPEVLNRLFQPFEQGTEEIVKRYGGLGLGMAISKALVEAQGGTIKAYSAGLGEGATFTVELPVADAASTVPGEAVAPPPSPTRTLAVLLVEDHEDTARALGRLLTRAGHHVETATNVAAALDLAGRLKFDILISDIGLPDGTGIDLIETLREKSNIPAVALTGYGMEDDVQKCLQAGFNAHLTKPLNFQKLEALISQLAFTD